MLTFSSPSGSSRMSSPMCTATTVSRLGLRASIISQRWYTSHLSRGLSGGSRVVAMAKKENKPKEKEDSPYSATVRLPVTDFSLRANSVVREAEIQSFWADHAIYEGLLASNTGEPFTLHDGPPYANGDLHIGHALNKVLKDFINRYQLLKGRKARFVPGWDTHGLPIELKVLQLLPDAERRSLSTADLRRKARDYALATVDAQRKQFKRFGVWADWEAPYVTLKPEYEAAQLQVFGKMFLNGHIYRGRKPVHWSPSSRTALAEAELEYPEGHKSRSIYVGLPIVAAGPNVAPELAAALEGAAFAIWTTTPWTIPANLAVAVNEKLDYCVVEAEGEACAGWNCKRLVVAQALMSKLEEKLGGVTLRLLVSARGAELEGCTYRHPLLDRTSPVVIGGDYITTETGTGLVHTAPGHGQEDYLVGQRYGLPLLSPVDDAGNFTEEAGPDFVGLNVQGDGNAAVITALAAAGVLLREESYAHKYPYDWRTKKPTIFRATSQWFASVEGFRNSALEAIGTVAWIPTSGVNRITNMIVGRSDWCISRQRKWGVPIPVFYNSESGEPLMSAESIAHVVSLVEQHGTDCWWSLSLEELLPESLRHLAPTLRKGEDTMDVWFDSGSSWAGVLQSSQQRHSSGAQAGSSGSSASVSPLNYPADLYLEGSDQHRGWFQSSLLTSVAAHGVAPFKSVVTHGFVVDEKGYKMSKSLGNVIDPRVVIEGGKDQKKQPPYGADVLRLWVASVDYTADVAVGGGILGQMADVYRKMRGTLRFLLGNLSDYDPAQHAVPLEQLPRVDRLLLAKLGTLMQEAAVAYDNYQFYKIFQSLQRFVVVDLSSFYLDVAKDRLYIAGQTEARRRSCQTVLDALLRGILSCLAPLAPHMAEDAWQFMPYSAGSASVFQQGWQHPPSEWLALPQEELALWAVVYELRDAVNATLERARAGKLIGSGLEACVVLHVANADLAQRLALLHAAAAASAGADDLATLLIVSTVDLVAGPDAVRLAPFHDTVVLSGTGGEVTVGVQRAAGQKCARCWHYSSSSEGEGADLCERCGPVVQSLGFSKARVAGAPLVAVPMM